MPRTSIRQTISRVGLFIEFYILPAVFMFFSLRIGINLVHNVHFLKTEMDYLTSHWKTGGGIYVLGMGWDVLLLIFYLSIFFILIRRDRTCKEAPEDFREVFIPLIATFWVIMYSIEGLFPDSFQIFLISEQNVYWIAPLGFLMGIISYGVSLYATFQLRESFGIVVMVNEIQTKGLYRYVRHPIYFGYLFGQVGMMLVCPTLSKWILIILGILVMLYRATLEEKKLAAFSEAYREYMKEVPFILPRIFKSRHIKKDTL